LRACGRIDGLERVRFTSPHPKDFTDDVIAAMAETPTVMPQLHMPLQSGSDRVLKAMRRSYRRERYLGIIDRVRAAMPDAAITTDIIVGFPGETEDDFEQTMDVVRAARFISAYTFQYSKRPGTPAATMGDQLPKAVVQERYERLVTVVNDIAWQENKKLVGRRVEVLVADAEGKKDGATHRLTGRARDNRLVHFAAPGAGASPVRPGDAVEVEEPKGTFLLPEDTGAKYVFVAGGIGITVFRSMLRYIRDEELPYEVTLVYSNRDRESAAFLDELEVLEREVPGLNLVLTMTDEDGWESESRRIDAAMLHDHLGELGAYRYLVAGPPAMTDAVVAALHGAEVSEDSVLADKFSGY